MCRLVWQLLGMLGNVLGLLGMLRNVESHIEEKPPYLLPYKLWSQGSSVSPSFHIWNLEVHYSLCVTAYKTASGGVSLRCETPKTLQKHAKVGQGPCKACQGPWKACRGRPRTLPSIPRSCKASLHILGSHKNYVQCIRSPNEILKITILNLIFLGNIILFVFY